MLKKLFFFVIILTIFFSPKSVSANTNFTTDYNITYTVLENGNTQAQIRGTLTNSTSEQYATSYKMQLGFSEISHVKAADADGAIIPTLTKNEQGYIIGLEFNKRAVGLNSTLPFSVTFETPSLARKIGNVWEINIPGVANPGDFASFTVTVVVPPTFGKPTYIKPKQSDNKLIFSKDELGSAGISIAFGEEQLYDFQLTYRLHNNNLYPSKTEIALPPTTNYQEIYITSIEPQPRNVIKDADGNWLAQYNLLPSQDLDVVVKGTAQVQLTPKQEILTQEKRDFYTKELPNWQINSPEIKALAKELKTAKAIYEYVVKSLTYDFSRVIEDQPRLGAIETLKNPNSAVCREFTDLFIALARAAGIPAREVDGYAYTDNTRQRPVALTQDILHAWPEYYDEVKQAWVMVDPTWENTTGGIDYFTVLDFDHIAFVKKGSDSDYPIPAGGYKPLDGDAEKDIVVRFTTELPVIKHDVVLTTDFPDVSIAGLPITGKLTMTNTGSQQLLPQTLSIISNSLSPQSQLLESTTIPPYGSQTWEIRFDPLPFLTKADAGFTIQFAADSEFGDKTGEKTIHVAPFFLTLWGVGIITGGILTIIILIIAIKFRRVRLSRQR
ncbi:MAG TPA: transglutaminase domain-containing protein [Patescibacteria group bacterium]|nr:transglutaminase domain-containing protein [Patescibacteria group bacterium]